MGSDGQPELAETVERLQDDIDEGLFTRGVQACVSLAGETVLDVAIGDNGLGRPVQPDTLFRVYCTIKPVAALAVAKLVDAGHLALDQRLADLIEGVEVLAGGVTLRHILTHTAGVHLVSGVSMEMVPVDQRDALLARQRRPPGWRVGLDAGYSEFFGWHLLGRAIEAVTGTPLREHLRAEVLDPLGLNDTFVGMEAHEFASNIGRIGVNVDLRAYKVYPMLFERTERVCREVNPAYGGYTTARDLTRLYGALLRGLAGETVDGLPSRQTLQEFCGGARPPTFDVVLDRTCEYGLGFMTGLADHRFGQECSSGSFGHSGNVGSSFAYADPAHDLAVAVVFNGIVDHESAFLRRPAFVRALYGDLHLLDEAEEAAEPARRQGLLRRRSRR